MDHHYYQHFTAYVFFFHPQYLFLTHALSSDLVVLPRNFSFFSRPLPIPTLFSSKPCLPYIVTRPWSRMYTSLIKLFFSLMPATSVINPPADHSITDFSAEAVTGSESAVRILTFPFPISYPSLTNNPF